MPHAKTHNAQKISPHSLHVYVASIYQYPPVCTMSVFAAGVAATCATACYLYFS